MEKQQIICLLTLFVSAAGAYGQRPGSPLPKDYPFSPAFISTVSSPPGHTELVVFPLAGKAFKIPIRSAVSFVFRPDGKALYGACTPYPIIGDEPIKFAICKVDLTTGATTPEPGTVSILDGSSYMRDPIHDKIFGFTSPGGELKTIVFQQPDRHPWDYLSLSPDGKRAVARHNGRVELIDVDTGTTKPLADEFFIAAFSPDGKWLAATEKGEHGRTILMDAMNLTRQRILGPSELDWSPDSRYLLGLKSCDEFYGTLEAINIETGERTPIQSSKCQINQATTGWVTNEILGK